ncbi:MAG: ABC transporter ATP-binding protein/permease [Candidatus Rokubacteria bacterium]|nr:ABC transporter ATP-binding protein/permease [Candidatus Rokubacteria bacterium]
METNLYRYIIRRSLRHQLVLIAIIFGLAFLNPWMLSLTKQIINKAIGRGDLDALIRLCALFLGAVVASGSLKYVKQNLEGLVSERMLRNLRSELYQRILRFPLPHFRNTSTGQLVAMMLGEVEDLGNFFGEALSVPAFHGSMLLGTLGFMVYQNPWLAVAGMALFPVQIYFVRKLQRRVTQLSRERVKMVRSLSDRIQESVGGIQEIYANETVAYEATGFLGQLKRIYRVRLKIYNLKYLVKWINNFLEKFGQFVLLLIGGWLIIKRPDLFDVGALVAFLQAYNQLNEPWRELINYFQQKENARVKYEQVIANFDLPELRPEFPLEERPPEPVPELAGAYDIRGASVVLDGVTRALDQIKLATPPHEHVAIVGTAGSGKTTLALVLAKLYGYRGSVLLDGTELAQLPATVAGRQIAYAGSDTRLFTGTVFENLIYGLRHRPSGAAGLESDGGGRDGAADDWLDLAVVGAADRTGLVAAALETAQRVGLDDELFAFGLRATIDPVKQPDLAGRLLTARRLVAERFATEGGEAAVEFFGRDRFASYASIGENILFGHSPVPLLALDRLAESEHFQRVVDEVALRGPLLTLGADIAKEMVEIFKDIPAEHELFVDFSLITAQELPEYARVVSRLERGSPEGLPREDQQRLLALLLRLIPARHRLVRIDEALMAKIVTARRRFAEALPPALAEGFVPYDRERYFADGTLLENLLFGKVVATSSLAVKRVNAIVEEVITAHGLRDVVMEAGLGYHVGLAGSRLSPVQRQRVGLARALLKRPNILILDQAVSALEPEKRVELHQRITTVMKGRTLIAVVDRLDLARYYDRVVVLDAGKVAELGTYQELAARGELFRQLAAQAGVTA